MKDGQFYLKTDHWQFVEMRDGFSAWLHQHWKRLFMYVAMYDSGTSLGGLYEYGRQFWLEVGYRF